MATILFYKPYGVLSQFTGGPDQATLKAYIDVPDVYAAGRLDKDSEGLLILSDDGGLIQRISSPRFKQKKTYLAQVEGRVEEHALEPLRRGVEIKGYRSQPAEVWLHPEPNLPPRPVPVRNYHPTSWLKIIISEGKNRQVRRMTAAIGYPTLRLLRVAIGNVTLEGLAPGQWRWASAREIDSLMRTQR